jgi:hypothetical protein
MEHNSKSSIEAQQTIILKINVPSMFRAWYTYGLHGDYFPAVFLFFMINV